MLTRHSIKIGHKAWTEEEDFFPLRIHFSLYLVKSDVDGETGVLNRTGLGGLEALTLYIRVSSYNEFGFCGFTINPCAHWHLQQLSRR